MKNPEIYQKTENWKPYQGQVMNLLSGSLFSVNFGGFLSSETAQTRASEPRARRAHRRTICDRFQTLSRSLKTNLKNFEKIMKSLQNQQFIT